MHCWLYDVRLLSNSGDPTVFGNLPPCDSTTEALVESARSHKYDGYVLTVGG